MHIHHHRAPLKPNGDHPAYRGYDAIAGKATLHSGRKYTCDCGKQFFSRADLAAHRLNRHCGSAA